VWIAKGRNDATLQAFFDQLGERKGSIRAVSIDMSAGYENAVNRERRAKAKLPEDVHHIEKWRLALQMIDELRDWRIEPPVILGDGAYGDITEFRSGLQDRELFYVPDVKGATSAYPEDVRRERPEYRGRGRPPIARYRQDPSSLKISRSPLARRRRSPSHGGRARGGY